MSCCVCDKTFTSKDFSRLDSEGTRVILQGRVYAVIKPSEAGYTPFRDYCTVTLYPNKGKVKYLKFQTEDEMLRWGFVPGTCIRCSGCLHLIDGKELVFDVHDVTALS